MRVKLSATAWTDVALDTMVESYLSTLLWSTTDDNGLPLDDRYDVGDLYPDTVTSAETDVRDFYEAHQADLCKWLLPNDAGHLLWLNRNGHGSGYWELVAGGAANTAEWRDRYGATEEQAADQVEFNAAMERLSAASKDLGGVDVYVGDDGKVHAP